jgi:hypothetical protein
MQGASLLLLRRDTTCNTSNWGPLMNTLWSILWPFSRALIRHGRSFPPPSIPVVSFLGSTRSPNYDGVKRRARFFPR